MYSFFFKKKDIFSPFQHKILWGSRFILFGIVFKKILQSSLRSCGFPKDFFFFLNKEVTSEKASVFLTLSSQHACLKISCFCCSKKRQISSTMSNKSLMCFILYFCCQSPEKNCSNMWKRQRYSHKVFRHFNQSLKPFAIRNEHSQPPF